MLTHNAKSSVSLIFGKRGCGKTTLAKELIKDKKRFIIIDKLGEYTDGVIVSNEIEALNLARQNPKGFKIVIRLQEERKKLFDVLYCITNYCLIVEELSMFCNSHYIDKGLFAIMAYGRHRKIDFIGISQRPSQMNPLIRTQADSVYCFKMVEPVDIKYLNAYGFGDLQTLKEFEHIKKEV